MSKKTLYLLAFLLLFNKTNAQTVDFLPLSYILFDKDILYQDSSIQDKRLELFYCDKHGNILDSNSGLFLIKIKKFSFVLNLRNDQKYLSDTIKRQACLPSISIKYFRRTRNDKISKKRVKSIVNLYFQVPCIMFCGGGYTFNETLYKDTIKTVNFRL
ncbi:MAG: hypothetical protein R2852_04460 [Bacteroidia bacterium]